jgi:hypothetical protein
MQIYSELEWAYLVGDYDGIVFHAEITYRSQFFCREDLPNGIIPASTSDILSEGLDNLAKIRISERLTACL